MSNTKENYLNKANATAIINKLETKLNNRYTKAEVNNLISSSGGGGDTSSPDGVTEIIRNATGDVAQIVFTYEGGIKTTTFSENGGTKTIVERDVKTGASSATVVTTTIANNQITQVTTVESIG